MHTTEFSAWMELVSRELARVQDVATARARAAQKLAAALVVADGDLLRQARVERQRGLDAAMLGARLWSLRGHVLEPLEFWGPNQVAPESVAELGRIAASLTDLSVAVSVDVDPAIGAIHVAPTGRG